MKGIIAGSSRRAALAAILACALLGAVVPVSAQAETPVTIGPAEVSSALFVAGGVARLSVVPAGTQDVVLEKAIQQLYADEPQLAPSTAEGYIREMEAALAASSAPSPASLQLMSGNQRIVAILATLERPYGTAAAVLPPAAKLAVSHLADVALAGASDIFAGAEEPKYFEPLADARTNLTFTSFAPGDVLRATRALAAANRLFGEARDALWGSASEESVFSEWEALLHESKALQAEGLAQIREAVEAGHGTLTEEPAQLTALFTAGQQETQEQACAHAGGQEPIGGSSINSVPQLQCSGGALYEAAHAPRICTEECEAKLAQRQSQAAKREDVIAQEHATMIAAAELLRPSDNTAAALQAATAQAQAQITEEEVAYAAYEAQKAEKEAIAKGVQEGLEAGTSVLALATENYSEGIGGLIGVGFELYEGVEGALSHPPPGPQEITLQAIADLSTQLAGFQQYTQEAFHAVNTQLAQLSSQLARENYALKEQLSELGERLQKEQQTIYALQDEVQTLFAAQTKANLQETIEDSVGWLPRTGEPLAASKFQEALVALKKDATEIANGALVNNAETQPYDFEGAYRQLTSKTTGEPNQLSEDISWLARFADERGWSGILAPASLANTTFWSESARAYAQLMLENASHATAADVAGLGALEKEGATLEKTAGAWSAPSGGTGSKTGNAILDRALASFEDAAYGAGVDGTSSVQTLLQEKAEASFAKRVEADAPTPGIAGANATGASLWGGAEQSFSAAQVAQAEYPALKWEECSGKDNKQQMPAQFIKSLPASLVNGVRLGVIGVPGSGDPLSLEACRSIGKTNSVASTETAEYREGCPHLLKETCEVVYFYETKHEEQAESVSITLTLKEGASGATLSSATVGQCHQTALFWTGGGYSESVDPEDSELDGDVYSYDPVKGEFAERHAGTVSGLKAGAEGYSWSEDKANVFAGNPCPYEGGEEKAGVEYAEYEAAAKPLGSVTEATLLQDAQARLQELQEAAYEAGREALKNPPVGNPVESLGGAKALIQSYAKLGLPQALDSDLALQREIEGEGAQFLDPEPGSPRPLPAQLNAFALHWVQQLEDAAKTSQSALAQVLSEDLIDEVGARSASWANEIARQVKPYVQGKAEGFDTGAQEPVAEPSALVESTLNRLQLTRDVLSEAHAPTAETLAPGEVGTEQASVRGEVDPNGGAVESCMFEYGATDFYGHHVECATIPTAAEKAVVVSAKITGWTPEGSFHTRVVLKTWGGTSYGEDVKVQLAQSAQAPSGGMIIATTDTSGATIGGFSAQALPAGVSLPAGASAIVGSLAFTVNVTPGGGARVKIELPAGDAPNALYKLVRAAGGSEYVEIPASLYKITANVIELTLVDGGPDDEDGEVNGVIVDPLVPVNAGRQTPAGTSPQGTSATGAPAVARPASPPRHRTPPKRRARPNRECISEGRLTVDVASHLRPPPGVKVLHSEITLKGKVLARLGRHATAAEVSFAGLHKRRYAIELVVTLSNGKTVRRKLVLSTCAYTTSISRQCVRNGRAPVFPASYLKPPRGTQIERTEILEGRKVLARLGKRATGAVVSFGRREGPYKLAIVAKLSNGHTLRRRVLFHPCAAEAR